MIVQPLSQSWRVRQVQTEEWLQAAVPGSVHTDLLAAGLIPDPFLGENEKAVQWVAETDWEYECRFTPEQALLAHDQVHLICEGLDTLAEVFLNGYRLGNTENMFRAYRWPVKEHLLEGENSLQVRFRSPLAYGRQRYRQRKLGGTLNSDLGGVFLRKAPSHFGWDWGPVLPVIGVWRPVRLEGYSTARLEEVHLRQRHASGGVTLAANVTYQVWQPDAELVLQMRLVHPDGHTQEVRQWAQPPPPSEAGEASQTVQMTNLVLTVENPQLWWPNDLAGRHDLAGQHDLGGQPLYQVEISLVSASAHPDQPPLDAARFQVGLRTLELRQEEDEHGRSFTFVVNGVPVFAKGANWIPSDSFPNRATPEQLEGLIASAAAAQMNMLRVWGGGYYPDEAFYDLCDRYGLLVWQDFMFACASYPLDEAEFLENVRLEVQQNMRRLRHRASLALWCGNNEIQMLWGLLNLGKSKKNPLTQAHARFFDETLPQWVAAEAPDTPYWPSSPASGTFLDQPNDDRRGDVHLWDVWHGLRPFEAYREHASRFVSEFGFESFPAMETIAQFALPEGWKIDSPVMLHHQRCADGNEKILYYLAERFKLPRRFEDLVYLSQVQQAEAMRVGVESWRRRRDRCSGTLYWQLNDCWPVTSWSSLDYYGRWKALHYAALRFYAQPLLSVEGDDSRMRISLTHDRPHPWEGSLHWSLEKLDGEALRRGEQEVKAKGLATTLLAELDFERNLQVLGQENLALVCELWQAETRLATCITPFVLDKELNLTNPKIEAALQIEAVRQQLQIALKAKSLARFVELRLEGAPDTVFSDNFFDLPANRPYTVTCSLPSGWDLAQAQQALQVRSLADVRDVYPPSYGRKLRLRMNLKPANLLMRFFMSLNK